jgi:O-antigen ligase
MRWVLIGYMFLFIHRPFEVWPSLGDLHIERVYMFGALLALVVCPGKKWLGNVQHLAYFGFALAVVVCWMASRPFVVPFWATRPSLPLRLFLAAYVALSFVCIGLTGSRSAFLGLVLCAIFTVLRSRWRWPLLVAGLLAAPVLFAALPPELQNRFETIIHPEVGPANAIESSEGRLVGLTTGLELFSRNPAFGIGPGAWRPATGNAIESHNLFGQLLGELGLMGGLTFAAILVCFWINLRGIRAAYRRHPEWDRDFLYHVSGAIALAVFLLLFEGNFGHNLFRYSWLWYGGFLIIARHCVRQREEADLLPAPEPEEAPAPLWQGPCVARTG